MTHSEQLTDLLTALCAARLAFPTITRNREGFSKRTGQKYGYADLNAIIDTTEPILGQHGLLMVQSVEDGEGEMLRITSTLFHAATGQWIASEISVEKPADMQNFGMTCTYLKRYAQQALLNISTEEDDDAAALNGAHKAETSAAAETLRASEPVSMHGHTPAPAPDASLEHPTEAHLAALRKLAVTVCMEEVEVYEQRIRTVMGLKPQASVAPRLLTRTQSMTQYMTLFEYYKRLEAQLAKSHQEAPRANTSQDAPASATEAAPTEAVPQDPQPGSAAEASQPSSSAPGPGPAPGDTVEALVADAIRWGLKEDVTRRVITLHKDLVKCRRILADAAERNRRQVA